MKYNTKPIDFTGCHPVIAEHLKRGEAIECKVWDHKNLARRVGFVVGYSANSAHPYQYNNGSTYCYAEPSPVKVKIERIMPPERAIPMLIAEGWSFDDSGNLVGHGISVLTSMFRFMGKPLSDSKALYVWPFGIIEEVEDE